MEISKRKRSFHHLRQNAVAYAALFVALGGTSAYAANEILPKGSVGTKQIKAKAVTAKKLRDGAVGAGAVADGSLGVRDLAPGTIPAGSDLSRYYDKQQSDERFLDQAEGDAAYLDRAEAGAAFLDQAEGDASYLDQSEGDAAYLDAAEGDSRYYTRVAADGRFQRGRGIRSGARIVSHGTEAELINIAGHGSLRAACDRAGTDRATVYWNPTPDLGGTSRIWMEGGNDAPLTALEKSATDTPRASMVMTHDDRATVDVYGGGGLSELTVISQLSDHVIGGGYCEFFVFGSIAQ